MCYSGFIFTKILIFLKISKILSFLKKSLSVELTKIFNKEIFLKNKKVFEIER